MSLFRTRTRTISAAQWNGTNEEEVRELLPAGPFPPLGYWVVVRSGGIDIISPAAFAAQYEPLL